LPPRWNWQVRQKHPPKLLVKGICGTREKSPPCRSGGQSKDFGAGRYVTAKSRRRVARRVPKGQF
jgi:hypothetical protein